MKLPTWMRQGRKQKWGRGLLAGLVLVSALAIAPDALANTVLHVDAVHGHDTGNCQAAACQTFGYAITQSHSVNDLVTIDAAAGTYNEDLALHAADSGLTIVGSGSGTTIIAGVAGQPTINADIGTDFPSSLSLSHLRILNDSSSTTPSFVGNGTDLTLNDVVLDNRGLSPGIIDGGYAVVSLTNSPVDLSNTASTGAAVINTGLTTLAGSPVTVAGTGPGVINTGMLALTSSPITLANSSGSGAGIVNTGPLTLLSSAIHNAANGPGIVNSGPLNLGGSPITLSNPSSSGVAIVNSGTASLSGSAIDVKGAGPGVINSGDLSLTSSPIKLENVPGTGSAPGVSESGNLTMNNSSVDENNSSVGVIAGSGNTTLANMHIAMQKASASSPALITSGGTASLSHVTISGAWAGTAINSSGSVSLTDSTLSSGPAPLAPLMLVSDGGSAGHHELIQRSVLQERSTTLPLLVGQNVDMVADSSELLGGLGTQFGASGGVSRTLTIASSTVDAGALGVRDAAPVYSALASADSTAGSVARVDIEGSILIEAPQATQAAPPGVATVNCNRTEVPSTTQTASATLGTINCASGVSGNTFTPALSSIFSSPVANHRLNPNWSGVDSVPAGAISVPTPFRDSATDLLGNPRVLNGRGTCLPGVRDKGAIELTGHGGVVPKPAIKSPAAVFAHKSATFTGSAPNVHVSTFSWHSSDGASAAGATFSHKFSHGGSFKLSLTASGAPGCTGTTSRTISVRGIDRLSGLKLSPKRFRAKHGTTISYRGSAPATVTFIVLRKAGRKTVKVGSFRHSDHGGTVHLHFGGRVGGHKLGKGSYKLKAVAVNGAGAGRPVFAGFTITG